MGGADGGDLIKLVRRSDAWHHFKRRPSRSGGRGTSRECRTKSTGEAMKVVWGNGMMVCITLPTDMTTLTDDEASDVDATGAA